ncbi:uncharacterized protein C8A04DRAFT_24695 [Dichotomopilus funicola]|uniref:Pheromone-regulated membrane protein n=1 Tax=Dichotomopilus funicola TaxID=1934379 RepID=A0AAN6V9Z1_9PEZI|nr:hypothetical protein C8A04DRAFT_24695 [Dichotomopilus funicola]
MGFLSHRRRDVQVNPEQKWDFISLNDFKAGSFLSPFAYGYLWFSLFISLAVYGVDIFTAYQLLAFNKWSGSIEPSQIIDFDISKWIFTVCILLSFANLAYEYFRAITIMRRGSVAECFLDSLAARLESIRMGEGRGWKRFLVFAELTKSKKGAEYIALFSFFSFQSWIRTLLCSGPRQVVNALTLYSVYAGKINVHDKNFESSVSDFFDKIRIMAEEEPRQVVVLSGMVFTLIIWIFSFLSLLLAALFFVFFLWSYIPREDGGLTGFCERKVNKRLRQIVAKKIEKAMAEEERKRKKAELKAAKKGGGERPMTMKPSIPVLGDDNLSEMPTLNRADTFATFAEKPSRPSTPGSIEMNSLGRRPGMPLRTDTRTTATSQYSSDASLLGGAAGMGMASPDASTPSLPPLDLNGYPPARPATSSTNRSYGPGPQMARMPSNGSSLRGYTASPANFTSEPVPSLPPSVLSPGSFSSQGPGPRNQSTLPYPSDNRMPQYDDQSHYSDNRIHDDDRSHYSDNRIDDARSHYSDDRQPYSGDGRMPLRVDTRSPHPDNRSLFSANSANPNNLPYPPDRPPFDDQASGRASPAPSTTTFRSNPMSPRGPGGVGPDGYPIRSATNAYPQRGPPQPYHPPPRSMTQPMPSSHSGSQRGMPPPSRQQQQSPFRAYNSPYHTPSASNSSLRNMVNAPRQGPRETQAQGSEYDDQADVLSEYSGTSGSSQQRRGTPGPMNPGPDPGPGSAGGYSRGAPARGNGYWDDDGNGDGHGGDGSAGGWERDVERGGRY